MTRIAIAALAALLTTVGGAAWTQLRLGGLRAAVEDGARWTRADAEALDQQVEELEERLLAHQARVSFWRELRERHAGVSAVACANLGDHATAMRASDSRFQVRLADQRKRRVASAAEVTQ